MSIARTSPAPYRRRFSTRQREVLECLEDVFIREGLRSVTLSDLTVAARCSRSTLYEIAPGKEQLFLVVLDRVMRRIAARGRSAMAEHEDPIDQVTAIAMAAAEGLGGIGAAFLESVREYEPAMLLYETHLVEARDFIATLLRSAVESGRCRLVDAPTIAETIVVIALHFAGPESDRTVGISATNALAETYGVLMAGLRPDTKSDAPE